ncbi:MAG: four helix bundle protein [Kiritimatiellia bacterium]
MCEQLSQGYAGRNVANQLLRPATSVATNYVEASDPESDAEFVHKWKVSVKELKERQVWMRFCGEASAQSIH